jgi:hypothetical protein
MVAGRGDEELWRKAQDPPPPPQPPPAQPPPPLPQWAPPQWTPPPPTGAPPTVDPGWVPLPPPALLPTAIVELQPTTRRSLVWETRFVMFAFLIIGVTGAVVALVQHVDGNGPITEFPVLLRHNPVGNLIVGIFAYFSTAPMVPLALFLLARTGQRPSALGLGWPSLRKDIWPALGLIGASYGCEIVLSLVLAPILLKGSISNHAVVGHVPGYYVIYGLALAAVTAINEEVLVNGYLLVRLEQLGWTPGKVLALSLALRTSYHIYYGVGFILTVPFGYFVTRSFQKNRRLNRSIVAHFLFDAILFTVAILA